MLTSVEYIQNIAVIELNFEPRCRLSLQRCKELAETIKYVNAYKPEALKPEGLRAAVLLMRSAALPIGFDLDPDALPELAKLFRDLTQLISSSPIQWIAALDGDIVNIALELAMACDHRITVDQATFAYSEAHLQLVPCSGLTARLLRSMTPETTFALLSGREKLSAQAFASFGLIDKIFTDHLEIEAVSYAETIAENAAVQQNVHAADNSTKIEAGCTHINSKSRYNEPNLSDTSPAFSAISRLIQAALTQPASEAIALEMQEFQALLRDPHAQIPRHVEHSSDLWRLRPQGLQQARPFATHKTSMPDLHSVQFLSDEITPRLCNLAVNLHLAGTRVLCQTPLGRDITAECLVAVQDSEMLSLDQCAKWRANWLDYTTRASNPTCPPDLIPNIIYDLRPNPSLKEILKCDDNINTDPRLDRTLLVSNSRAYSNALPKLRRRERCLILETVGPDIVSSLCEPVYAQGLNANQVNRLETAADQLASAFGMVCLYPNSKASELGWALLSTGHRASESMLIDGASPSDIDTAMRDYGFSYGIFEIDDLMGLDSDYLESGDHKNLSLRSALRSARRLGKWMGKGWYDYLVGQPIMSRDVAEIISQAGIAATESLDVTHPSLQMRRSQGRIMSELLLTLQQAAIEALEMRKVMALPATPDFLDLILIRGFGFPPRHGGPIFMDSVLTDSG